MLPYKHSDGLRECIASSIWKRHNTFFFYETRLKLIPFSQEHSAVDMRRMRKPNTIDVTKEFHSEEVW